MLLAEVSPYHSSDDMGPTTAMLSVIFISLHSRDLSREVPRPLKDPAVCQDALSAKLVSSAVAMMTPLV